MRRFHCCSCCCCRRCCRAIDGDGGGGFVRIGGSLYIFSRKVCRGFRNDKHTWEKKKGTKNACVMMWWSVLAG